MPITTGTVPKRPEDRARRNAAAGWVRVLPPEPYTGPIPDFPLAPARAKVERVRDEGLWEFIWRSPQGHAWATMGPLVVLELARYVRLHRSSSDKAAAEIRQIGDRFGMSPLSMARLRWTVSDESGEPEAAPLASVSPISIVAD
jgi:hypothetical protein